jgi:hypothetical protein
MNKNKIYINNNIDKTLQSHAYRYTINGDEKKTEYVYVYILSYHRFFHAFILTTVSVSIQSILGVAISSKSANDRTRL